MSEGVLNRLVAHWPAKLKPESPSGALVNHMSITINSFIMVHLIPQSFQ
jgi:hypothetical protein